MPADLLLLLHMHQPDYRDPDGGDPVMPWVRLHATRGYTDVPALALEAGAGFTLNLVPSLVDQLQDLADGRTDRWERLSRAPAEALGAEDRAFIRARFVHGHPAMRRVSRRYQELEARIGALTDPADLRDLQVWSNLAWMGVIARRDPFIEGLFQQDRAFTHGQLIGLMDRQRALVAGVLPLWRRLPSIATSPYTHPILPLLVDFQHARRNLDRLPDDVHFAWPDDAARQLQEAVDRASAAMGRPVRGMWPSEGSVSPEVVALAGAAGVTWLATDEGVLHRSGRDGPADVRRAWRLPEGGPALLFRDRELSDRIGFVYASWDGAAAAADLLSRLPDSGVVPIVLDGENPWESYPDAGEAFLRALFASGRCCTAEQALARMPEGRLHHLHTGSWIHANFAIWAGDPMDRAGWRRLSRARAAWEAAGRPEAAWPALRAAEGSDWFWWYGPEHHSEMRDLFDLLFRKHLAAAWAAMGQPPPDDLQRPVWTDPSR